MTQVNATTGEPYTNGNQMTLQLCKEQRGYDANEWLTFVQATNKNRKVKKGEHGVKLVRVVTYYDEQKKEQKGIKTFVVFNVEQTEAIA